MLRLGRYLKRYRATGATEAESGVLLGAFCPMVDTKPLAGLSGRLVGVCQNPPGSQTPPQSFVTEGAADLQISPPRCFVWPSAWHCICWPQQGTHRLPPGMHNLCGKDEGGGGTHGRLEVNSQGMLPPPSEGTKPGGCVLDSSWL